MLKGLHWACLVAAACGGAAILSKTNQHAPVPSASAPPTPNIRSRSLNLFEMFRLRQPTSPQAAPTWADDNDVAAASQTNQGTMDPIRINCGGSSVVDSQGVSWEGDKYYNTGFKYFNLISRFFGREIDKDIFQTYRFDFGIFRTPMTYTIPVPNGDYEVLLYFTDVSILFPERRRFDVYIEDARVFSSDNIEKSSSEDHPEKATMMKEDATVIDGDLKIKFDAVSRRAYISAIVVQQVIEEPLTPADTPAPTRAPVRLTVGPPTVSPTSLPTSLPRSPPTRAPVSAAPSIGPKIKPTDAPSAGPTIAPNLSPTTEAPTSAAPTIGPAVAPTTATPTGQPTQLPGKLTQAPVTSAPTGAPVTVAPVTEAPVSEAPVTEAPVSEAPVTEAPVPLPGNPTQAPVTSSPTDAPVTVAPVTDAPVSLAPVTDAPVSLAPVTEAPVSLAPVEAPVSLAPVTEAPVSSAPITAAPVPTNFPTVALVPNNSCESMPTDRYVHVVNTFSKLLLSVEGDSTVAGANVYQEYQHDSWRFEDAGNGYFHIIAENSGLALALGEVLPNGGSNVVQKPYDFDAKDEDWCFRPSPSEGSYQITNRQSGQTLEAEVDYTTTSVGLNVGAGGWWGGEPQQWFLEFDKVHTVAPPPPPPSECAGFAPNTFFHIVGKQSNMAVSVLGASKVAGANLVQVPIETPGTADHWRFTSAGGGYYQLFAQHSGMALQAANGGNDNGIQGPASPDITDDWCFVPVGDGYYRIQNRATQKYLEVQGESTFEGANVQAWWFLDQDNQIFGVQTVSGLPAPPPPPAPTPTPPTTVIGVEEWKGPFGTPVTAVAAANLPGGKILMWSAYKKDEWGYDTGQTETAIFDPIDDSFTEKVVSNTQHDMFCPGTSTLPDGRIMITGGADAAKVTFYNPQADTWTVGPEMIIPRGYHSNTVLADGSVLALGGSWHGDPNCVDPAYLLANPTTCGAKDGEVWSATSNTWRLLPGVPIEPFLSADLGGVYRSDNHPWLFLAPDGRVFHAGPSKQMNWVTTVGAGSVTASLERGTQDNMSGNAVLYDIGKILVLGGAPNYDTGAGTTDAFIIDINGAEATVAATGKMAFPRTLSNSVLLPSGEVVVIGGQTDTLLFSDEHAVFAAEIFDPTTEKFTTLGSMQIARNYHSTAMLMQDGRVMAAGGGLCGGCAANHRDLEILTPPYLLDSSGELATRPVIASLTSSAKAGETFTVRMSSAGSHTFAIVRISAVTHTVNNDQRRIPLAATKAGKTFTLTLPANINVSLAGAYYLFAMDAASGVPSVGADFTISL